MNDIKKLQRTTKIVFILATLCFVFYALAICMDFLYSYPDLERYFPDIHLRLSACVTAILLSVPLLAIWILFLSLLRSVWTGETPFRFAIVRRIKALALLLILHEPYSRLVIWCEVRLTGYTTASVSFSIGNILAGLVLYCVALIFQYGIALQAQADETL